MLFLQPPVLVKQGIVLIDHAVVLLPGVKVGGLFRIPFFLCGRCPSRHVVKDSSHRGDFILEGFLLIVFRLFQGLVVVLGGCLRRLQRLSQAPVLFDEPGDLVLAGPGLDCRPGHGLFNGLRFLLRRAPVLLVGQVHVAGFFDGIPAIHPQYLGAEVLRFSHPFLVYVGQLPIDQVGVAQVDVKVVHRRASGFVQVAFVPVQVRIHAADVKAGLQRGHQAPDVGLTGGLLADDDGLAHGPGLVVQPAVLLAEVGRHQVFGPDFFRRQPGEDVDVLPAMCQRQQVTRLRVVGVELAGIVGRIAGAGSADERGLGHPLILA